MLVRLIRAGWSDNGRLYSREVLQAAARDRAWPAGTACYIDHATDEEEQAYPAGTIKNLAAVLTEDARWDESEQALLAEVRLFHPWRETLIDMHESIGMSIRAWVSGHEGDDGHRSGFIVDRIEAGRSVDFVTVPAAGGGIVSVLEAVGNTLPVAEARNCGHWFESRIHAGFTELADRMFGEGYLNREERITLSSAVGDALAAFAARIEADAPHLYERDPYSEPEAPAVAEPAMSGEVGEAVSNKPWSDFSQADYDISQWHRACLAHTHDGDPSAKSDCRLPVREPSGTVNRNGVHAAAGRINQLDVPAGEKKAAAKRLVALYRNELDEDPPPALLTLAGSEAAAPTTPSTASAVTETVTDGAPPTAPNPPIKEEPVSGTQAGAPPVQAGTATVVDTPPVTSPPVAEAAPAQEAPRPDPQILAALEAVNAHLAENQKTIAALADRVDQRDAENRALRNNARATEAVATVLRANEHADVAVQIGPRVTARILANVPTTAEGSVDESALTEAITAAVADEAAYVRTARAQALEEAGVGLPRGLGSGPAAEAADDGLDAELKDFFVDTLGLTEAAANVATKGRTH